MFSVLFELVFGIFLFLAALALIPRLLSGDKMVYEIALPFAAIFIASILLTNNLNLSLLLALILTAIIYYLRSKK